MPESEIHSLDSPRNYKKRESSMNNWLNIIFKMMDDGHSNETIYFYIQRQPCFHESKKKLLAQSLNNASIQQFGFINLSDYYRKVTA